MDSLVLFFDKLIKLGIEESNDFRRFVVDDFLCLFVVQNRDSVPQIIIRVDGLVYRFGVREVVDRLSRATFLFGSEIPSVLS